MEIQLRRGRALNEMSKFRYDVILHIGERIPQQEPDWLDWQKEELTLPGVRDRFKTYLMRLPIPNRLCFRSSMPCANSGNLGA